MICSEQLLKYQLHNANILKTQCFHMHRQTTTNVARFATPELDTRSDELHILRTQCIEIEAMVMGQFNIT